MKKHLKKEFWNMFVISFCLSFLLLFIAYIGFISLGSFLVVQENYKSADAIIVLSGGGHERIAKGVELYQEGVSPLFVVSGGTWEGSISNAEVMALYAEQHGVLESSILQDQNSHNTYENALFTYELFQEAPQSIILITSEYHQKRAQETFQQVYKNTIIYNAPAQVDFWKAQLWWENQKSFHLTMTECIKIMWGRMTGRWS